MFLLLVFYDMTTDSASLRRDTNDKKSLHLTDNSLEKRTNSLEKRTLNSILGAILSVVVVLACVQSSVRARVQERQMTPPPSGSKHYQSRNSSINRVRIQNVPDVLSVASASHKTLSTNYRICEQNKHPR